LERRYLDLKIFPNRRIPLTRSGTLTPTLLSKRKQLKFLGLTS
jgi:hypothetical protein